MFLHFSFSNIRLYHCSLVQYFYIQYKYRGDEIRANLTIILLYTYTLFLKKNRCTIFHREPCTISNGVKASMCLHEVWVMGSQTSLKLVLARKIYFSDIPLLYTICMHLHVHIILCVCERKEMNTNAIAMSEGCQFDWTVYVSVYVVLDFSMEYIFLLFSLAK